MSKLKDRIIQRIGQNAHEKVGDFSREFVSAKSEDKEEILAGMEFYRDLADMCDECLGDNHF